MKIQTITAVEQNGCDMNTMTIVAEILSEKDGFDLEGAIKDAVKEYIHTEDGKEVYDKNSHRFNWGLLTV